MVLFFVDGQINFFFVVLFNFMNFFLIDFVQSGFLIFVKNVNCYIFLVIIVIGFIGNVIFFLVFCFIVFKKILIFVYLVVFVFLDIGFLFCVWIVWFDNMDMYFFYINGVCQIVVYLMFVFSFIFVWFVNVFMMEMYIFVFYFFKVLKVCCLVYV